MVKEGLMYLIPNDDELINKSLPERINSLINNILIDSSIFNYNTCYININTSGINEFKDKSIRGVTIKIYNCLPVNTYWFVKETV